MKVKLANVALKLDKIGNSIIVKEVTPAELLFLIADHHSAAGGNPVLSLEIVKRREKGMVPEKDATGRLIFVTDHNSPDGQSPKMIPGFVNTEEDLEVEFNAAKEKRRLMAKYQAPRISKFFEGAIPTMPTTFDEAMEAGIEARTSTERLLTVGDTGE